MMKKKQYSKQIALLLSALSVAGVVHAQDGTIEIDLSQETNKAVVQHLVGKGVIAQIGESSWYEINHSRLNELTIEEAQRELRQKTVDLLRKLMGPDRKVEDVRAINMILSSQDYRGSGL